VVFAYGRRQSGSAVGWMTEILFLAGEKKGFPCHHIHTSSVAHPVTYPVGTGSSFPGDKAARV